MDSGATGGKETGETETVTLGIHRPGESLLYGWREMVMATLRWMGVPEAGVGMVEGTYEETKGRVIFGPVISEEFRVSLFNAVAEVIRRKTSTKDNIRKLLYADDLAVVADSEADLQER